MTLKKWYIIQVFLIIMLGSILHFTYEWTNNNFVAVFSAVNESTWEHLKLLFWPAFFFSIVEYFLFRSNLKKFIISRALSFYIGILTIIILFYSYTALLGDNFLFLDISIFIISVILSQYIGYRIYTSQMFVEKNIYIFALVAIVILVLCFIIFTFNPPQLPIFKCPITGEYGI